MRLMTNDITGNYVVTWNWDLGTRDLSQKWVGKRRWKVGNREKGRDDVCRTQGELIEIVGVW